MFNYFIILNVVYHKQLQYEFKDTKGVIKIRKLKNRQHNGQEKKDKKTKIYKTYTLIRSFK